MDVLWTSNRSYRGKECVNCPSEDIQSFTLVGLAWDESPSQEVKRVCRIREKGPTRELAVNWRAFHTLTWMHRGMNIVLVWSIELKNTNALVCWCRFSVAEQMERICNVSTYKIFIDIAMWIEKVQKSIYKWKKTHGWHITTWLKK